MRDAAQRGANRRGNFRRMSDRVRARRNGSLAAREPPADDLVERSASSGVQVSPCHPTHTHASPPGAARYGCSPHCCWRGLRCSRRKSRTGSSLRSFRHRASPKARSTRRRFPPNGTRTSRRLPAARSRRWVPCSTSPDEWSRATDATCPARSSSCGSATTTAVITTPGTTASRGTTISRVMASRPRMRTGATPSRRSGPYRTRGVRRTCTSGCGTPMPRP